MCAAEAEAAAQADTAAKISRLLLSPASRSLRSLRPRFSLLWRYGFPVQRRQQGARAHWAGCRDDFVHWTDGQSCYVRWTGGWFGPAHWADRNLS